MKKRIDLLNGNIAGSLAKLALPLMGISFIQMAYNLTDIFWIGKLGAGAVAAVGTGGLFVWFSTGIHTIAQLGGQVYVGQNLGAKKFEEAGKYAHASMFISIVTCTILGLAYYFATKPLISFFNLNDPIVVNEAITYLMYVGGFIFFMLFSKLLTTLITTTGDSKTPFIATLIGLLFNIIFDPLLIFGYGIFPELGVLGAALATVLAQIIVFSILLIHVLKDKHLFKHVHITKLPNKNCCMDIIKLGLPTTLQNSLFPLVSMYLSRLTAGFGDDAVAVQRIGSQIESISWMTTEGFAIAVNSFVAQNYGANNIKRTKDGIKQSFLILSTWGIFTTLSLIFLAKPLFSIFISETHVVTMGTEYLMILGMCQLFMCWEILSSCTLNAFGKTIFPAITSVIFTSIRVPLAIVLSSTVLALNGIWFSFTISTILKGLFLVIGVLVFTKKLKTD